MIMKLYSYTSLIYFVQDSDYEHIYIRDGDICKVPIQNEFWIAYTHICIDMHVYIDALLNIFLGLFT